MKRAEQRRKRKPRPTRRKQRVATIFTRSFDTGRHPAYDALVERVMSAVSDPKQMEAYSTPEQIAEVVFEAATDGKDQLRYVAGADARATYAARLQMGDEAFRKAMGQRFFGAGTREGA